MFFLTKNFAFLEIILSTIFLYQEYDILDYRKLLIFTSFIPTLKRRIYFRNNILFYAFWYLNHIIYL